MEVLIIVSPQAKYVEIKKVYRILKDLAKYKCLIKYLNIGKVNQKIPLFLEKINYTNYQIYSQSNSIDSVFKQLKNDSFNKIIVVGLIYNDHLTKYFDDLVGTNTDLYITASEYGILSDGDYLINQGAYLLSTIYDLMRV